MKQALFVLLSLTLLLGCRPDGDALPPGTELEGPAIDTMICDDAQRAAFAEQFNFTCVQECPAGMDEFAGQLGNLCVKHYGIDELQRLPRCGDASDCSGACAYATHATSGSLLTWEGPLTEHGLPERALRCVPADYQEFLVHTVGFSSVDESGELSTVIA